MFNRLAVPLQGGYFFISCISLHNATNRTVRSMYSAIQPPPLQFMGSEEKTALSFPTMITYHIQPTVSSMQNIQIVPSMFGYFANRHSGYSMIYYKYSKGTDTRECAVKLKTIYRVSVYHRKPCFCPVCRFSKKAVHSG